MSETVKHNATLYRNALGVLLKHEGGYVHDPLDRGGETYKGISRKHWPQWEGWAAVDAAKELVGDDIPKLNHALAQDGAVKAGVADFYRKNFWDAGGCDRIAGSDYELAARVFNAGVNVGVQRAVCMVQDAINETRLEGASPLAPDGDFGPKSQAALCCASHPAERDALNARFQIKWMEHYLRLVGRQPKQARFANGWASRALSDPLDEKAAW